MKINRSPNFDVIIDDGLHKHAAQLKTFKNFWPLLSPEGFYIIEDMREWRFRLRLDIMDLNEEYHNIDSAEVRQCDHGRIIVTRKRGK